MPHIAIPQTQCRVAVQRADITPPVGAYHRMWGAAKHDRSTGVHRPLTATLLWLAAAHESSGSGSGDSLIVAALDHCILDVVDVDAMRSAIAREAGVPVEQVLISLSHTHAAGLMSRSRSDQPGGDQIGPYLDRLIETLAGMARLAAGTLVPAAIVYGTGRCDLAAHRDLFDANQQRFVCGFHPDGPADDTLVTARITDSTGQVLATLVNYACHPTTLAWDNTLISPDWPGAMRELIESATAAPCVFLQGASGDLGPREGFVGDTAIADRHGRQLGHAALAVLESLPAPGTRFEYRGPVVSGTLIGTWAHQPLDSLERLAHEAFCVNHWDSPLPYRSDLPTIAATRAERDRWQTSEQAATQRGDTGSARDCRAKVEQMTRQLWRLEALPAGPVFPLRATIARLGSAVWVFVPGEHYQSLQTTLRKRFPHQSLVIATLSGGWQPGYVPPAATWGYGIYQEVIAVVGPGSAELLIEDLTRRIQQLTAVGDQTERR